MTFFGGGRSGTAQQRPAGRPHGKSILAVGSRALVTQDAFGDGNVALSDELGHTRIGSVMVGAEVELTAWRPRGGWETRYRIRLVDGSEGWVDAANLRARPEPTPPPRAAEPSPASEPSPAPRAKRSGKPRAP